MAHAADMTEPLDASTRYSALWGFRSRAGIYRAYHQHYFISQASALLAAAPFTSLPTAQPQECDAVACESVGPVPVS